MTEADERHLRRAIDLAAAARATGDMPYGSLLVGPAGDVLAENRNTVVTDRDIAAHPELKLARWAARHLDAGAARLTTMYTSCRPFSGSAGQAIVKSAPSAGEPAPRQTGPMLPLSGVELKVEQYLKRYLPAALRLCNQSRAASDWATTLSGWRIGARLERDDASLRVAGIDPVRGHADQLDRRACRGAPACWRDRSRR